jgi:ribosomal protein L13E
MLPNRNRRSRYDWLAVQQYFDAGNGFVACRDAFGFSHTAWIKAIRRGELTIPTAETPFRDRRRKHDWSQIQQYYDEGHSYLECRVRFRFSSASGTKAVRRGALHAHARARLLPLNAILISSRPRVTIKRRLIEAGILLNECEDCGLREWRGKPLSIQIDHRNGVRNDNRVENLRMLCPNCHSQTVTFGGRNRSRFV